MIINQSQCLNNAAILFVVIHVVTALNLCAGDVSLTTMDSSSIQADKAWNGLLLDMQQLEPPREWLTNRPTPEVLAKYRQKQAEQAVSIAHKEREFYSSFPKDPRAEKARNQERQVLGQAERFGNDKARARLAELDDARLSDPNTKEDDRFEIRITRLQRDTRQQMTNGMAAALDVYANGARQLLKDFPQRDEPYEILIAVAMNSSEEKGRILAQEIVDGAASEATKAEARTILKKLDMLGKPFNLKFTARDGKEIDLSKMKGKVVLVDFWATWSGPYTAALPKFKTVYEQWHSKGCEVVGISFDTEKEALDQFLTKEKVEWPQYFDGQGWKNKIGLEYGIKILPSLWLMDKKGVLRDLDASDRLEQKLEKYLAE